MKQITSLALLLTLFSCTKSAIQKNALPAAAQLPRKTEACSFGLTAFNTQKRAEGMEASMQKVKPQSDPVTNLIPHATILLDFDGQLVTKTMWNSNGDIHCAPANLSGTEIDKILLRVSEDFAPFDVQVTTNEALYEATDPHKRMRVVVTETYEWYGTVGGIAHYGSFTWGDNTPCFVFSTLMGYNEKYIAEAISHEVGHTLGLQHQASFSNSCSFLSEYNAGAGEGETSWAPIMGVSYYRNVTTWNKGAVVSGCGMMQDDLAMISGILGWKQDENTSFDKSIMLENRTEGEMNSSADVDYYFVDLKSTTTVSAHPHCLGNGIGANLHMKLNVYSKKGDLIGSYSDPSSLSAIASLQPGKYYVAVETIGNQYQDRYGMLGRYVLSLN